MRSAYEKIAWGRDVKCESGDYRGYGLRRYETMGNGKTYFEVWKDGVMWGFALRREDAEIMIDRMIEEG